MMWKEFEELAGCEVSYKTYTEIIEPMYMALPDGIDKRAFIGMLNLDALRLATRSEMVAAMRESARDICEKCGIVSTNTEKEQLHRLADKYASRFYGSDAHAWIEEAVGYSGARLTNTVRGCRFCDVLHIYAQDGAEYERLQLVPRIMYRVHTGKRGKLFDSLAAASIYANDHQRRTGDFVAVTEEVERFHA